MKQAILITAYKNLSFLHRIIERFDEDFEFYIHIDKKCKEFFSAGLCPNVHVYRKYRIDWGDVNHLYAIVFLIQEAAKDPDIQYFHLITGSDYPIKSLSEFKDFFEKNKNSNFLEYYELPRASWGKEGGLDRIKYYWLFPNTHGKIRGTIVLLLLKLQRKLHFSRDMNFDGQKLFCGGTYWSVSRKAIDYLLNFLSQHPSYLKRYRWTSIAEETFFHTIWLNSGLQFENDCLRYFDWSQHRPSPKILDVSDYNKITNSKSFFARKMNESISNELIGML